MPAPRHFVLPLLLAGAPGPVVAQTAPEPAAAQPRRETPGIEDEDGTIVVSGQRLPGSVIGDVPPEVQLGPAEIRSYGVSTVTDLLAELTAQTTSGRGRGGGPVVLLNGRRISGLGEIRDIPTEAIQRVEVLPEEVALKYGYTADQKVVNFVLRRRFRAVTTEMTGSTSTQGGATVGRGEASLLRIDGDGRLNLSIDYQNSGALTESDRGITAAATRQPFALAGNVTGSPIGSEIDPALSALAGQRVTVAAVPAAATSGAASLAQFTAGANAAVTSDVRRFRTIRPVTDQLAIDAVFNRTILGNVSATVSGSFGATGSESLRGLPGAALQLAPGTPFSPFAGPVAVYRYLPGQPALRQSIASETGHLGLTLNGDVAKWHWTLTGNYDHTITRTVSTTGLDLTAAQGAVNAGSLNPFGPIDAGLIGLRAADRARAVSDVGDLQLVANGTLLAVPAGDLSTTLRAGVAASGFDTRSVRSGVERSADLSRRSANGQINVDLPLTSRRNDFLSLVGDLSANFNAAANHLSDFGTLGTIGYGVTWKPRDRISLIWSVTDDDGAPTVQQLGNPQVETAQVRVFDYLRGTTVDVTRIDGGNPALLSDNRHVEKFGATLKPFDKPDLSLTANYVRSRIRNSIASLPSPTAAIEAASPDRFVRDAGGQLLRIDNRPVNYARERNEQLRWGLNFSLPLKSSQRMMDAMRAERERRQAEMAARQAAGEASPGAAQDARSRGEGRPGGPGGPGGFGPRGPGGPPGGGGRLQFAAYHTWIFRDDILIRDGLPLLDLLDGAARGNAGGQPRHAVEVQAGASNNGLGARVTLNWQEGTFVRAGGAGTGDLSFSSLTTANLRLFANVGGMPAFVGKPWARGLRVTLGVNNLFNQRLRVRDATGATPLGFQPAYLDPVGREVRISLRKLLF